MAQLRTQGVSTSKLAGGCGITFILLFGGFWSLFTLGFDGFLGYRIGRQLIALTYPIAAGTITQSKVVTNHDGDGDTHKFDVAYKFRVGGREFTGTQYRYGDMSSNDHNATRLVARHPVGSNVTVHYPSSNPTDAVILAGIDGSDLFMPLFMTPFNLIMLGFWYAGVVMVRGRRTELEAGGLAVTDRGGTIDIRMPATLPLAYPAAILGLGSFAMIFVLGFTAGFNPPLWLIGGVWTLLLGAAVAGYWYASTPIWNGEHDLQLDLMRGSVILPKTYGRTSSPVIKVSDITGIAVEKRPMKTSPATSEHAVVLYHRNERGSTDAEKLTTFFSEPPAESLADWLRTKLRR